MRLSACDKQAIGTPEVLACHLAYINHMVHEAEWDDPADLARWFHLLAGVKGSSSVSTLNMTIIQARRLPLRINVRPAIRISDKKKLFVIDFIISANLPPETDLRAWFDEAHQVIRDEFLAQTTKEAQKQWGLPYSLLEALVDPGPRAEEVVRDFAAHVPGPALGLFEPARDISQIVARTAGRQRRYRGCDPLA
jgi:hypothetical protein